MTESYTEVVDAFNYETRDVFNYEDQVHLRYVDETRYRDVTRDVFNYRDETRTGTRETLITEDVFNYDDEVRIRMVEETRYRWVDRTVTTTETRTRLVCCRPVTRQVTTTETVTETESATPDAACTAAGYTLNSASVCSQAAGADLGDVAYECDTGWTAAEDDQTTCERTTTRAPGWDCPDAPAYTLDTTGTTPHCHLVAGPCPPAGLGTLAAGTATRTASWSASCRSERIGSAQSPHYAKSWTFALDAAATVTATVTSTHNTVVYLVDSATNTAQGTAGARLAAGSYLVEVTTAAPRTGDGDTFTLTLTIATPAQVTISGLTGDTRTPQLGDTTATVTSGFTVAPTGADCEATTPQGATVTPAEGADRTVSYDVPEGTTVTVTVRCTSGDHSRQKPPSSPPPTRPWTSPASMTPLSPPATPPASTSPRTSL